MKLPSEDLWKSMPVDPSGHVSQLKYVPRKHRDAYEQKWREWCRLHPKRSDWPDWLHHWADEKKMIERHGL